MNVFLVKGILLILRWLQFIGSRQLLGDFKEQAHILSTLLAETQEYSDLMTRHVLHSHGFTNEDVTALDAITEELKKKVM